MGNFDEPIKISIFVKDIYAGFSVVVIIYLPKISTLICVQLNLKNDQLRRRFDSLKYDLKKIEEGLPYSYILLNPDPTRRLQSYTMYRSANCRQHLYLSDHRRDTCLVSIIGLVLTIMDLCMAAESECNVHCIACLTYVNPIKSEDCPRFFMTEGGPDISRASDVVNG